MSRKIFFLTLFLFTSLFLFLILLLFSGTINFNQSFLVQKDSFPVRNLVTCLNYTTIQEAIDAPETLSGHRIRVSCGVYYEHLNVSKALSIVGENTGTTVIDGGGRGTVVGVTSDNVELGNLTIQNGVYGIRLSDSRNSRLNGINAYNNQRLGVELNDSGNCTLRNNSLVGNGYNFGVDGDTLSDFINDIDVSNTVNGKPIYYLINQRDLTIDSSTFSEIGYLGLVNSSNVDVEDLRLTGNKDGILFAYTTNSTIKNVKSTENWFGIYIAYSVMFTISGNDASNNLLYGIRFFHSKNSTIAGNSAYNNGVGGVSLVQSCNSTVIENNAGNNMFDIHIVYTNNSVIGRNNARGGEECYSVAFYYSNNNVVHHNNFANGYIYEIVKSKNTWDDGFEGNYWSCYNGTDANEDGIGDKPYVIGENNEDNFPLMGAIRDFDGTWNGKFYEITAISNSSISQFEFNPADGVITFSAAGEGGTVGFCRIAVPEILVVRSGGLIVLVDGRPPVMQKNWTDGIRTYIYVTFWHEVTAIPDFLTLLTLIFFVATILILAVLRRRRYGVARQHKDDSNYRLCVQDVSVLFLLARSKFVSSSVYSKAC